MSDSQKHNDDTTLVQRRHGPACSLERARELIVACPPMRSAINLSRIVRASGCFAVERIIACGTTKLVSKIARDTEDCVEIERHRTLPPVLKKLKAEGYRIVALEQTDDSHCIYDFAFERRTVLVVGNERLGVSPEVLALCDEAIEIPVHGSPDSHNAATATCMAIYEYCRQFPAG